jgi:hypothetical protein
MKNPRPRSQRLAQLKRCTIGEDPGTRRTRDDGIGQPRNGPISPIIRGRVKKTEYSRMSRGGTGGMPESFGVLLTGRGSTLTRSEGAQLSFGKESGLVLSLKSCGTEEGPTGLH